MTIALVLANGESVEIEVQQVEFVRFCRYHRCKIRRFQTINVDQVYCSEVHKVQASQRRAVLRRLGTQIAGVKA